MSQIGTVESIWRYLVKNMRGETLDEVFVSFASVMGDRKLHQPYNEIYGTEYIISSMARFGNRQ